MGLFSKDLGNCPDCGGSLGELDDERDACPRYFRCSVCGKLVDNPDYGHWGYQETYHNNPMED